MCGFFDQVVSDVHKTNRVAQNEREKKTNVQELERHGTCSIVRARVCCGYMHVCRLVTCRGFGKSWPVSCRGTGRAVGGGGVWLQEVKGGADSD